MSQRNQPLSAHLPWQKTDTGADLFAALAAIPRLPDAACKGRSELFDEARPHEAPDDVAYRHAAATRICQDCPALQPCRAWVDSLKPSQRPVGVVCGRVTTEHRPAKKAAS